MAPSILGALLAAAYWGAFGHRPDDGRRGLRFMLPFFQTLPWHPPPPGTLLTAEVSDFSVSLPQKRLRLSGRACGNAQQVSCARDALQSSRGHTVRARLIATWLMRDSSTVL